MMILKSYDSWLDSDLLFRSDITELLLQFGVYDLTNPSEEVQIRYTDSVMNHPGRPSLAT